MSKNCRDEPFLRHTEKPESNIKLKVSLYKQQKVGKLYKQQKFGTRRILETRKR